MQDLPLSDIRLKGVGGFIGFDEQSSSHRGSGNKGDLTFSASHGLALDSIGKGYTCVPPIS